MHTEATNPSAEERAARKAERLAAIRENTEELRAWARRRGKGATTLLADKADLTFAAAARIIKGQAQPNPETAKRIERATGCSAAKLLGIAGSTLATNIDSASADQEISKGHAA